MEPLQLPTASEESLSVTKQLQRGFFSKFLSFSQGHAKREASKKKQQHQQQPRQQEKQENKDNDAIHCYIINYDDMMTNDAEPEVYCTSNKAELAKMGTP